MEDSIVLLDVGGALFRTTRSTLCKFESFFSRMLTHNTWLETTIVEGNTTTKPIFIDRGNSLSIIFPSIVKELHLKKQ